MADLRQISSDTAPRRRRIGLATILVGGVTLLLLLLLGVGSGLALLVTGATQNTFSLLGARATATLDLVEGRIDHQFGSVGSTAEDLSAQFADGRLNFDDQPEEVLQTFSGILTALPQVTAVLWVSDAGPSIRATVTEGIVITVPDSPVLLQRQARALEVARHIEAEGGTVDKYIGDAIMAFWGAPEQVPDHAARAPRAATEIQRRVRADNDARRARGEEPLRIRVGIHTGRVTVGNIGSKNRVNYTVVGDAVNTASRIDSLAKKIATEKDCIILISGETRDHVGTADADLYDLKSLGEREIRGHEGTVSILQLDAGMTPS
jgi:class 3 adenylate cyclase